MDSIPQTVDPGADGTQHGEVTAPEPTRGPGWHQAARQARLLSWLSLAYMAAEGTIAIIAATLAGSVALLGFGLIRPSKPSPA